jgi:hypothetical protein
MSKGGVTLSMDHDTDAHYRVYGQQMKTFLTTTLGLTQTSDTGQADWTTATRPATNTLTEYEIYRFNDSAQSTRPFFFKIRYGTASSTGRPQADISFGEGSNGTGSLTGAVTTSQLWYYGGFNAGMTLDVSANWNATVGYFGLFTSNAAGYGPDSFKVFSVERLRNTSGGPTTEGFSVVFGNNTGTPTYKSLFPGSWSSESGNTIPLFWPVRSNSAASSGGTFISGLSPLTGRGTFGPLEKTLGFCGVGMGDMGAGASFSITRWDSVLHNYLATPCYGCAHSNSTAQEANCRNAILWD